jgi:superoxide reductase
MKGRRDFLKGSVIFAGAAIIGNAGRLHAAMEFSAGLIYTQQAQQRWTGKEGARVPKVTLEGKVIKVVTPHPMNAEHYIVKHTLVTHEDKVLGDKTFANTDNAAESSHTLPEGFKGTLLVTSFCNIHDFWLVEFTV